jgi:hypothetical protein
MRRTRTRGAGEPDTHGVASTTTETRTLIRLLMPDRPCWGPADELVGLVATNVSCPILDGPSFSGFYEEER